MNLKAFVIALVRDRIIRCGSKSHGTKENEMRKNKEYKLTPRNISFENIGKMVLDLEMGHNVILTIHYSDSGLYFGNDQWLAVKWIAKKLNLMVQM
jgi:hypothetical protein